jgi:hypothetical protein
MIVSNHTNSGRTSAGLLRKVLMTSAVLACAAALSPASADITTMGSWDGSTYISTWGVPDTATYGQTFTASTLQGRLTSFTVDLLFDGGVASQYQAFVYAWDGTKITGSALYSSGILTAPSSATFTPITINTGGLILTPGQQYVFFLTTSTITGQSEGDYHWGGINPGVYADGTFVYMNNGTNFGNLSSSNWNQWTNYDLAFTASLTPLSIVSLLPANALINPTNVAEGIDNSVLNHGGIPTGGLGTLYGLSGSTLTNALAQVSGEIGADPGTAASDLLNPFITTMGQRFGDLSRPLSDPSMAGGVMAPVVAGGSGAFNPGAPRPSALMQTSGAAPAVVPASPEPAILVSGPNHVWGAVIGGVSSSSGDAGVYGTHGVHTENVAFAAGVDVNLGEDALVGGAISWGRVDYKLRGSLGNGGSNAWQIGLYGTKRFHENAYVSVVGAAGFHNMKTSRYVTILGTDHLVSRFHGQIYAGRIEGGYRFLNEIVNLTPYAALQIEGFTAPAHMETAASGASTFALGYERQNSTNVRTELGVSIDHDIATMSNGNIHLFGRTAWVHNEGTDVKADAAIMALSGSDFTVFGVERSRDAALFSLGAQIRGNNGLSLAANANAMVGEPTLSFYGSIKVAYTW